MTRTFCLFSALYHPSMGGVEKYTENLAATLTEMGNRVFIVTENVFDQAPREVHPDGTTVVRLPARGALNNRYPLPIRKSERHGILAQLADSGIDHVVVNTRFYPLSIQGLRLAASIGIRPLLIEHGSAHLTMGNRIVDKGVETVEHLMTRSSRRFAPAYYGVSNAAVRWLGHFGIEGEGVLPNAIDADAFVRQSSHRPWRDELGINSEDFLVAFTGRLTPEKGILPLVEAAGALQANPRVKFAIAGKGPLESKVRAALPQNAFLVGALEAPDVASLLQSADAFCLPTRSEGFSTSLLEAAAAGVAPIMPQVGGTEELVPDERYGIVLPSTDANAVAEAIGTLERHRDDARQKARNIARLVRNQYSWRNTAEALIEAAEKAQQPS